MKDINKESKKKKKIEKEGMMEEVKVDRQK
jgi:hypothetical protein